MDHLDPDYGSVRRRAMAKFDALPLEVRELVWEFGYPAVKSCMDLGIRRPGQIRHLIHKILEGSRADGQGFEVRKHLDWVLMGTGANAGTVVGALRSHSFAVVPIEPNAVMLKASMAEVSCGPRVSKEEKHRLRLRAAVRAGFENGWGAHTILDE